MSSYQISKIFSIFVEIKGYNTLFFLKQPIYFCFQFRFPHQKTQEMIESKLVKRSKNKMIPDGKKMIIFIDDLNMPRKDIYGSQPPLELIRLWMDYEGWFDCTNRELFTFILIFNSYQLLDFQVVAELKSQLEFKTNSMSLILLCSQQVKRIYQSILAYKFQEFEDEIKLLIEPIAQATYNLFQMVTNNFLPTPTPAISHYVFNMRDITIVIQGVYQLDRLYCDNKMTVLRLLAHECLRVFHDRLISVETVLANFMEESGGKHFEVTYNERENLKKFLEEKLIQFNTENKSKAMNIVLFQEAVYYICKINCIINFGKGQECLLEKVALVAIFCKFSFQVDTQQKNTKLPLFHIYIIENKSFVKFIKVNNLVIELHIIYYDIQQIRRP